MIVPDLDLLIYAYNEGSQFHHGASVWWADLVNGTEPVSMPWQVSNGFIRQMSNSSVINPPRTPPEATRVVAQWFGNDHIVALESGPRYLEILERILAATDATRRLVADEGFDSSQRYSKMFTWWCHDTHRRYVEICPGGEEHRFAD